MLQQPSVLIASTIASQRYYKYSISVRYLTGEEIVFADWLLSDDRGRFLVLLSDWFCFFETQQNS
jgi:hypothetical protein